jgi:hypothetical protein
VVGGVKTAVCAHPEQPSATAIFHGHVKITPDPDGVSRDAERDKVCEAESLTKGGLFEGQWNADGVKIRRHLPYEGWSPAWKKRIFQETFNNPIDLRLSSPQQRIINGQGGIEGSILANPASGLIWVSLQLRPYLLQQVLTSATYATRRSNIP